MKREVKKLLKKGAGKLSDKMEMGWFKKKMVKAYLKSPPKVQYALAKFGVKTIVNKKKMELEELIRH